MSEINLRFIGICDDGGIYEFGFRDILEVDSTFGVAIYEGKRVHIDPATIQLAEDPRKAMLDGLRLEINKLREYKSFVRVEGDPVPTLPQIAKWCVIWILDEMEAKL